jgi:AraC-like DNA-binding protein
MKATREMIYIPSGHSFRVIRWDKNLEEVESVRADGVVEKVTGEGTRWHFHVEMELTLFVSGSGLRFTGDHIGEFEAGDLVLLGEKLPHYWDVRGDSSGISLQWDFSKGHAFWGFPETAELAGLFKKAGQGILLKRDSARAVAGMMSEMLRTSGMERLGLLLRLLGYLARVPARDGEMLSNRSFSLAVGSMYQEVIGNAVRYLIANFREEIRLEELLEITGLSKGTFSRQFKIHVGRTFSGFLLMLRVQAAARDLKETNRTVTEIAYACGFGQMSFFNRSFRKWKGMSPGEWRRLARAAIEA